MTERSIFDDFEWRTIEVRTGPDSITHICTWCSGVIFAHQSKYRHDDGELEDIWVLGHIAKGVMFNPNHFGMYKSVENALGAIIEYEKILGDALQVPYDLKDKVYAIRDKYKGRPPTEVVGAPTPDQPRCNEEVTAQNAPPVLNPRTLQ